MGWLGFYSTTLLFGPEDWRINAEGKAAYVALDELHTSIQVSIGRDEYGGCVRRALLKVKPYLESENAKSCPVFAEWIGKSMAFYMGAAERWNEPFYTPGMGAYEAKLHEKLLTSTLRVIWGLASDCLLNARKVMGGNPAKVRPLSKDALNALSVFGKEPEQNKETEE